MPDTKNIHNLYWLNAINHGADEAIVATTVPIPNETNVMGRAQQSSVPEVVNSNSQLHVRGRDLLIFIHGEALHSQVA